CSSVHLLGFWSLEGRAVVTTSAGATRFQPERLARAHASQPNTILFFGARALFWPSVCDKLMGEGAGRIKRGQLCGPCRARRVKHDATERLGQDTRHAAF